MLLGTPPYDRVVRSLGHLLSRFRSERVEGEVSDAALLVLIVHRRDWLNGRLAELTGAERDDIARVAALLLRIADS